MCGNKNTSTTSTSAPNPAAMGAYNDLLTRAQGVSNTPFTPYTGEMVAPVNTQQQAGISNINQNAGFALPYINQAAGYANAAAAPISASDIAQYQSPWTQQVIDATRAQFANTNAQQQSQLTGNAASQGALGGDRVGVAQAILAGQQQTAQAPVIANLEQQGFTNAQQMALAQRQNLGNAAYSLGNLGVAGQGAALQGAGAQVGAGSLEQQTQQAQDAALMQEFMRQQAYPFQTTQWLAGIDTGVGSQMGGTSTTTPPPPNPWSTAIGLGVSALGAFAKDGGRVKGFALGGTPYGDVQGYVPTINITGGSGAPKPPSTGQQQSGLGSFKDDIAAGKGLSNLWNKYGPDNGPLDLGGAGGVGDALGTVQDIGSAPELGFGLGPLYAKGGGIPDGAPIRLRRGFDDGGPVTLAGFGAGSILPDYGPGDVSKGDRVDVPDDRYTAGLDLLRQQMNPPVPQGPTPVQTVSVRKPSDDDSLPPEITHGSTSPETPIAGLGAGTGEADAYSPEGPTAGFAAPQTAAGAGEAAPTRGGLLSGFGLNLSPEAKQGLIAAGLGMMASRSPYLGQAIGEGGLQGLQTYQGEKKQALATKKTEADIEHGKNQLAQQAKLAQDRIALETKKLQALEDYRKAELAKPFIMGQDQWMRNIYGVRDEKGQIHRIDAAGNADSTPSTAPVAPTVPQQSAPTSTAPASSAPAQANSPGQPTRVATIGNIELPADVAASLVGPEKSGRNEDFLSTLPPDLQGVVKGLVDYRINPGSLSIKGGHREQLLGLATRYDPSFDQRFYPASQKALSEFTAGGPQSPAGILTNGNTAILHAAEMSDAIEKMRSQPGFLNWAGRQDIPFVSYRANQLNNAAVRGTAAGTALSEFETARQRFSEEVTKFYSGTGGSEAERERAIALLDSAKSLPELRAAISQDAKLMRDKVAQLVNRLRAGMGPSAWKQALENNPESVLIYKNSDDAFKKIRERNEGAGAAQNFTPQQQEAIKWANENPNDPRAAQIKKRLRVQ